MHGLTSETNEVVSPTALQTQPASNNTHANKTRLAGQKGARDGQAVGNNTETDDAQAEAHRRGSSDLSAYPNLAGPMEGVTMHQAGTVLVDYESPAAIVPVTTNTSRKSMEPPPRQVARQGLPSPAPSDEATNSPIGNARNVGYARHPQTSANTPPYGMFTQNTVAQNARPAAHAVGMPAQQSPSNGSFGVFKHRPSSGQPRIPQRSASAQAPTPTHPSGPPTNQPRRPSGPQAAAQGQIRQASCQTFDTHQQAMLHTINMQLQVFEALGQQGRNVQAEIGRLSLLHDAIQKKDWFYIVLAQLHCVRTDSPKQLPQDVQRLDPNAWYLLDLLLAPNQRINRELISFCADFPNPLMAVYSSPAIRQSYEGILKQVIEFLQRLPRYWQTFLTEAQAQYAPPLVSDMVEHLYLLSPVLQTTTFRAIARTFWGGNAEEGIAALVNVHQLDQATFLRIRTPAERQTALGGYRTIYQEWQMHQSRLQAWSLDPQTPAPRPVFQIPPHVLAAFSPATNSPFTQRPPAQSPSVQPGFQQRAVSANVQSSGAEILPGDTMRRAMATFAMPPHSATNSQQLPGPAQQRTLSPYQQQQYMQMQAAHSAAQARDLNININAASNANTRPKAFFPDIRDCPRAQPTHPDADRVALHQAHLRSPQLGRGRPDASAPKLYRHVVGFVRSPTRINPQMPMQTVTFDIDQSALDLVPASTPMGVPGEPKLRELKEGSQTYRLRCAQMCPKNGFPNEASWVVADNVWPEHVYFDLNDKPLEPRRKLHHGRYLPIDLTEYLQPGKNSLTVVINRCIDDMTPFSYAIAIEIVGVTSHEKIISELSVVPANDSLTAIRKSLSGKPDDDHDDEVAVMSSILTLKLFDPISGSKIFDTPVRGRACLHKDCFDLETFLSVCKRQKPGWPTVVDCWRCPICRGDVRPQELVVDGFLVDVRKELEDKRMLDTRAIIVNADGRWMAKAEERTGVRSPSLERDERDASAAARAPKKVIEVIELD